jgi:L-threonylcarbamoyladenylate synthase
VLKKETLIIKPASPLDPVIQIIRKGGVIAYPTETFYALGVDPFNVGAVEKLVKLKARPASKPISIIIKDVSVLKDVTREVPPVAGPLMERFWPGPLTIVFKAMDGLPIALTGESGTIGVRVSANPTAGRLAAGLSGAITATSANPSDEEPPVTAGEVLGYFDGEIDALIDGGRLPGKNASTIVDVTGGMVEVLRAGAIPKAEILRK